MMAKEKTPERSIAPSRVTVTITVPPPVRGRPFRERLADIGLLHRARTAGAAALAVGGLGAIIAIALPQGSQTGRSAGLQGSRTSGVVRMRPAHARGAEKAAIAAAFGYPYPLRCLTITIAAGNPDYARANVDRTNGCGRYRGYVNASFHRVDGTWRLVLDEGQLFVPNALLIPCQGGCTRAGREGSRSRTAGSRGVRAAYAYPLGCLSIAIALVDPRFARADFDRTICRRGILPPLAGAIAR
jgi:hypothetical protein